MLDKEICEKIWKCHREIDAANDLLEEVENILEKRKEAHSTGNEEHPTGIKNAFGEICNLELGVPSGSNSKRLFTLSWELAVPVIEAHIAKTEAKLKELNGMAKLKLEAV